MAAPLPDKFQFAIDRGGTFTDVFARCPDGKIRVMKLLSEDPAKYRDAPTEGIRRILQEVRAAGLPVPCRCLRAGRTRRLGAAVDASRRVEGEGLRGPKLGVWLAPCCCAPDLPGRPRAAHAPPPPFLLPRD